jgi:hypothetical protein
MIVTIRAARGRARVVSGAGTRACEGRRGHVCRILFGFLLLKCALVPEPDRPVGVFGRAELGRITTPALSKPPMVATILSLAGL